MDILLTLLAAYAGMTIARKLKLPIPYMLGPMVAVAALNVFTGRAYLPKDVKVLTQSVSGVFIGLSLNRSDLKSIKQLAEPTLVLILCYLGFTTAIGLLFHLVFHLDAATSFLVAIPGGVSEITLMADEVGADPPVVSFLQTFRLFSVYLIFPASISRMSKKFPPDESVAPLQTAASESLKPTALDRLIPDNEVLQQILTLLIGIAGGCLGKLSGLPAGTLSFAMIATILVHLNSVKLHADRQIKRYVQILAGALIGCTITREAIKNITHLVLPALTLILAYLVANYVISWLMTKTRKIDRLSAMFASSPGGASDMALIASELGGDSPKIAIIQFCRLISCYTIFPVWAKFLIARIG